MLVFSKFFKIGIVGIHLISCIAANCLSFYVSQKLRKEMEFKADQFAAKLSPTIAAGCLELAHYVRAENLSIRASYIKDWETKIPPGFKQKAFVAILKLIFAMLFSDKGDFNFDWSHPSWHDRIKKIKPYLAPTDH